MYKLAKVLVVFTVLILLEINALAENKVEVKSKKCDIPANAPKRIEAIINYCQEEVKLAILSEALDTFGLTDHQWGRAKREAFSKDERRMAGCLLQCVYRKMHAVNKDGFPTVAGLVNLYAEGVKQEEYRIATSQAVNHCLNQAQKKHLITPESIDEDGKTCDIAYDVFDCVSEEIMKYCGQSP